MFGLQITDTATRHLEYLLAKTEENLVASIQHLADVAATEFAAAVPLASKVSRDDRVRGILQNYAPLTISKTHNGTQISFRPFYLPASSPITLESISGRSDKLRREGLWVHKKTKGGAHDGSQEWVEFSQSPRLMDWARQHQQLNRAAVLIDDYSHVWRPYAETLKNRVQLAVELFIGAEVAAGALAGILEAAAIII